MGNQCSVGCKRSEYEDFYTSQMPAQRIKSKSDIKVIANPENRNQPLNKEAKQGYDDRYWSAQYHKWLDGIQPNKPGPHPDP